MALKTLYSLAIAFCTQPSTICDMDLGHQPCLPTCVQFPQLFIIVRASVPLHMPFPLSEVPLPPVRLSNFYSPFKTQFRHALF